MNATKKNNVQPKPNPTALAVIIDWFRLYEHKNALLCLTAVLFVLSALAATNFNARPPSFAIGEMASGNVLANKDLVVEDTQATQKKRDQLVKLQPGVFSLHQEAAFALRAKIQEIFTLLNQSAPSEQDTLIQTLSQNFDLSPDRRLIALWSNPDFQNTVSGRVLPFLETRIRNGVVGDFREFLEYGGGIIIQDITQGTDEFRGETAKVPDLKALEAELALFLKNDLKVNQENNLAISRLVMPLTPPSLTLNRERTNDLARAATFEVEPVTYHVQKGETIVRQGERVSREQQLKINALLQSAGGKFNPLVFWGVLIIAVILSIGFFLSPSGRLGSKMTQKDLFFISLLLFAFIILDKLLMTHAQASTSQPLFSTAVMPYLFPVAGVAGLSALVFSARRYCVLGLLMAFFCTLMANGDMSLFMFYFLGAMWNTWLVSRTQNRHEMLFSGIPLTFGLLLIWIGCAGFSGLDKSLWTSALGAVLLNGLLSLLLIFALSPILEITFHYTTRFRLMELMNLEQPLLQQLMMSAPGTYHHCLIVSNLVEAAAKSVGANSLLCKVAALYHDIGKLAKPDYFIENLFGHENKHSKLAPSMSALILVSHVKKGVELAEEHKLGEEITDIIRQHHGTNVIRYFYQKSLNAGENPNIDDYRYPGPRPQSKEAAIVMLADAVEASSRTLTDPTPGRLQSHVENIVKLIFSEGQLDESSLTFRDLNRISESFLRILTGIFHSRIEYPEPAKG